MRIKDSANTHQQDAQFLASAQKRARQVISDFNLRELEAFSRGIIPEVLLHFRQGKLSVEQARVLISERYAIAHFFVGYLNQLLSHKHEERQLPILQATQRNLEDELGGYGAGRAHAQDREVLLEALQFNYLEWQAGKGSLGQLGTKLPRAARRFILGFRDLLRQESIFVAAGALLYYEGRISRAGFGDYYHLLCGLEKFFPQHRKDRYQAGDAFFHISDHAKHDDAHEAEFEHAIASSVINDDDIEATLAGMNESQILFEQFWKDVALSLRKRRHR